MKQPYEIDDIPSEILSWRSLVIIALVIWLLVWFLA